MMIRRSLSRCRYRSLWLARRAGYINSRLKARSWSLGFINGRPDAPIVRNTLQDDQPLPSISPGEQLQQQRAGVSQRVTKSGSWQRETDQAIEENSRQRIITGDTETRELKLAAGAYQRQRSAYW
ncbi:Uncharacterised protein [Klebsiella michiganensis]|uniref:Uncharacterized protein n=1 Tax=Klebsiella michiganensis TaxID=1134687 RepID=A0A7H4MYR5_9ENTR|nr:Uncharacterised protein [Klebsiella michiganensis]